MQKSRLVSLLISFFLHGGLIAFVLFWPAGTGTMVDLSAPVIDIGIYTIGSPGKAPKSAPEGPKTPVVPTDAPALHKNPVKAPETAPPAAQKDPDPVPERPEAPTVPESKPVEIPEEKPLPIEEPKVIEAPKEDPKPVEKPKAAEKPESIAPAKDKQPTKTPSKSTQPKKSSGDVLGSALRDLSGSRNSSSSAIGDALGDLRSAGGTEGHGTGPGGSGGTGGTLLGSYMQSLVSRIKPNWEYVGRADRRNPTAVAEVRIGKDGTILDATIIESSGDTAFDGSVLKAIMDTGMVEPPPTSDMTRVRVPFAYEAIK